MPPLTRTPVGPGVILTPTATPTAPPTGTPTITPTPTLEPTATATLEPTVTPAPTSTVVVPTPAPTPTWTPVPLPPLNFVDVRTEASVPSQVQIVFSMRDEEDRAVIVPVEQMRVVTRVYEKGAGSTVWEEIDSDETNVFIETGENLELEVVFVLDFSASMAQARADGGGSGVEAMLAAFEEALDDLVETHRVGLVEFHDRSVEPAVLSGLTTDREAVQESVLAFLVSSYDAGSSRIWDSIEVASELFASREDNPIRARALIFFSDGRDTSSLLTRDAAGSIAEAADIQLYALGVGDVFEEGALEAMVRSTGGVYYPTGGLDAL